MSKENSKDQKNQDKKSQDQRTVELRAKEKSADAKISQEDQDITVDMYHVKSRWTVILFGAFIIAFLIFALAIFLYPQPV